MISSWMFSFFIHPDFCSHELGEVTEPVRGELPYTSLFFISVHVWSLVHLLFILLQLLSPPPLDLLILSVLLLRAGPPARPQARLHPPLLGRGPGGLLGQPPPALSHVAQQEKTQHDQLPHQQPGARRPRHVRLLRPADSILRFWPARMGIWSLHVSFCHGHAVCSCLCSGPVPHGHCSGPLHSCGLSHPWKSRVAVLLGSGDLDLAVLHGFIYAHSTTHCPPGPAGCRAADGRVWGVLGRPGARPPHLLLFQSLLLLLCPTGCCHRLLLCHILSAEEEDHVGLDGMSRVEICKGCMEQTEEEDLQLAVGVCPLLCLLVVTLTGTGEWEGDADDLTGLCFIFPAQDYRVNVLVLFSARGQIIFRLKSLHWSITVTDLIISCGSPVVWWWQRWQLNVSCYFLVPSLLKDPTKP